MKKIIIGNWKMNPKRLGDAKSLFQKIKRRTSRIRNTKTIICPPYIFIESLSKLGSTKIGIGAQDCFYEKEGAYTGQISAGMLRYANAKYVIIGHSEKRALGDNNEILSKKVKVAIENHLKVILCVGEKERDSGGNYLDFIRDEVVVGLSGIPKSYIQNIIIAYEPIWAIGKDASGVASPQDFREKSIFIRKLLSTISDNKTALTIPILYGGSVDSSNTEGFLKLGEADGLLVGRSSLDADDFVEIIKISERCK